MLDFLFRKSAHLTEYGIFAIFIYHSLSGQGNPRWSFRRALASVAIAGLYSLTDEFHQRFVPGRTPALRDSGLDTVGAMLGTTLFFLIRRFFFRSQPSP